jgi:hypothetical protein
MKISGLLQACLIALFVAAMNPDISWTRYCVAALCLIGVLALESRVDGRM